MFVLISFLLVVGCSSINKMIGATWDENKLKNTVSFDTQCPEQKINVVRFYDEGQSGTGRFEVQACDKLCKYLRFGASYYEQSKSPIRVN